MEIINFTRLHPIFSILAKHNHTGFPYPIILNFRKPLTRNWSSWAKFLIVKQPSFVITSFYELITITLDSINMIIIFSLDAFPVLNHRHTLKKENVQEHMRKRVVSRKNFERMPVLFRARHRLESAAFLPPDGNRVRDIPYFCLVRKCTGGNEFSTRSWTLMHVWTSRWWTLSPAWIGEIHEGR